LHNLLASMLLSGAINERERVRVTVQDVQLVIDGSNLAQHHEA
jgi:hypothetical protein